MRPAPCSQPQLRWQRARVLMSGGGVRPHFARASTPSDAERETWQRRTAVPQVEKEEEEEYSQAAAGAESDG